jgi:hypothetical protein
MHPGLGSRIDERGAELERNEVDSDDLAEAAAVITEETHRPPFIPCITRSRLDGTDEDPAATSIPGIEPQARDSNGHPQLDALARLEGVGPHGRQLKTGVEQGGWPIGATREIFGSDTLPEEHGTVGPDARQPAEALCQTDSPRSKFLVVRLARNLEEELPPSFLDRVTWRRRGGPSRQLGPNMQHPPFRSAGMHLERRHPAIALQNHLDARMAPRRRESERPRSSRSAPRPRPVRRSPRGKGDRRAAAGPAGVRGGHERIGRPATRNPRRSPRPISREDRPPPRASPAVDGPQRRSERGRRRGPALRRLRARTALAARDSWVRPRTRPPREEVATRRDRPRARRERRGRRAAFHARPRLAAARARPPRSPPRA